MIQLRPYQKDAVRSVFDYWSAGGGNPLVEIGTGLGKSLVNAQLCKDLLGNWPDLRIGSVTHVRELISQNAQEMLRLWPQASIGINSAGLGRRDLRSKILFCGIQSVHKKNDLLGSFDVLTIDEAHLISRKTGSRYQDFINRCRDSVPDMRLVLLTATGFRTDSGRLDQGDGAMADKTVFKYGIGEGVRDGYLCPLLSKPTEARIDISGVHVRAGDFVAEELQEAAMSNVRPAVAEIVHWGKTEERKGWLVFATGVEHAKAVRDEVRRHGVTCEIVTGDMPNGERDMILAAYKAKRITCIASVNCILTGFNAPHVDLLCWLRDTISYVIWVQGNGRGTRVLANLAGLDDAEDRLAAIAASLKPDCRVLDFTGNGRRLGPVDAISIPDAKVKPTDERGKHCPECNHLLSIGARTCGQCSYSYPVVERGPRGEPKHEARADSQAVIMASITPPQWLVVREVNYARHLGRGKPDSLRVTYECGLKTYDEWVPFESERGRFLAEKWWRKHAGYHSPTPLTVAEALDRIEDLTWPREIAVKPDGKYWRVVAHKLPAREVEAA